MCVYTIMVPLNDVHYILRDDENPRPTRRRRVCLIIAFYPFRRRRKGDRERSREKLQQNGTAATATLLYISYIIIMSLPHNKRHPGPWGGKRPLAGSGWAHCVRVVSTGATRAAAARGRGSCASHNIMFGVYGSR